MTLKKKNRFKPLYKQFLKLRENVQSRRKLLKFKKKKWEKLIQHCRRKLRFYKRFKAQDQEQYLISKYPNRGTSFQKRFRNTLQATKRLAIHYGGLSRSRVKNQIKIAYKKKTSKNFERLFLEVFETKLSTVLYRSKFSPSIRNAQQLIVHGKVFVNNKLVKSKFYTLKTGDLITIDSKYYRLIISNIRRSLLWPIPPKHLLINYKTMQIVFGEMRNVNFSTNFSFNLNLGKVLRSYKSQ